MQRRNDPSKRRTHDSIASRLDADENRFRILLMERIVERRGPVNLEDLAVGGVLHPDAPSLLGRLSEKRVVVQDEAGNINFVYPVSALPTRHRVSLADGRRLFGMCAVDAMGVAFTFRQNVRIDSECAECGEQISIGIERGELAEVAPSRTCALHVDLRRFDNWAGSV